MTKTGFKLLRFFFFFPGKGSNPESFVFFVYFISLYRATTVAPWVDAIVAFIYFLAKSKTG
jgi:hypothetical protein